MTIVGGTQFTGAAGQYYVAYSLSARKIHAAVTLGNAPYVDVLASNCDGSRQLALQVKTARNAHRPKRYGYELREWEVGAASVNHFSENLWYAFVDLNQAENGFSPSAYLVPSMWVGKFVKADWSRKMYMLKSSLWAECCERWDRVEKYMRGEQEAIQWANSIPDEAHDWGDKRP